MDCDRKFFILNFSLSRLRYLIITYMRDLVNRAKTLYNQAVISNPLILKDFLFQIIFYLI